MTTTPVTERHRKLVYDIRSAPFSSDEESKMAADFEREVRLDEARWWFEQRGLVSFGHFQDYEKRIAALEGQK